MADWINKLGTLQNKLKLQLHSKKIDDLSGVYVIMG